MGCFLAWGNDHLGLGCWDERSWCGLFDECLSQFWKSILDITEVGNARTHHGCIGCSIDGKKSGSPLPGRPRTVHWVAHHTSAIPDVLSFAGVWTWHHLTKFQNCSCRRGISLAPWVALHSRRGKISWGLVCPLALKVFFSLNTLIYSTAL